MNNISCIVCGERTNLQDRLLSTVNTCFTEDNLHFVSDTFNTRICDYNSFKNISEKADCEFVLLITNARSVEISEHSIARFAQIADMSGANMLYSDYYDLDGDRLSLHPLTDHHLGCVRDDFALGNMLLIRTSSLKKVLSGMDSSLKYGALYALRLELMKSDSVERIPEPLYTVIKEDFSKSGEVIFDYVNPANRDVQIEMEKVFTAFLVEIGAFMKPPFKSVDYSNNSFKYEASVIIPVRDRAKTIKDAIDSVMTQECNFPFNLIVVDNHSTDGTTEIIKELKSQYSNIIHLIPESNSLGIGGCWNLGVNHPDCGKFAIQLDSDDVYNTPFTIQKVVDCFNANYCAMVIGSYQMMNFDNEPIPPGIIDHKEWSDENGANNALRINGLGAPRAFYTPILRKLQLPNTSYGEDYAVGIALSREYKIGRIYDPIYNCRRWEGNSDANLDINKMNTYNAYKDRLRYFEIKKRILIK